MRARHIALLVVPTLALSLLAGVLALPAAAAQALNAPVVSPVSSPTAANPELSWAAVPGAIRYHVQLATGADFGNVVYGTDTVGLQATPPVDLPGGTLYWHVAATDSNGTIGAYSAPSSFAKIWGTAPQVLSPRDGAIRSFPADPATFSWHALAGASSYELQIDEDAHFSSPTDYTTVNTSFVLSEPQVQGKPFYWQVRGLSATSGVVSQWSQAAATPQVPAHPYSYSYVWNSQPTPLTPANSTDDAESVVSDPTFTWQPVPGAATYVLDYGPNKDFTNNTTEITGLDSTSFTPPRTLSNGSYFWRVRAVDDSSARNLGTWSDTWSFRRPAPSAPQIVAPLAASGDPDDLAYVNGSPTFSWTPVDHAAHYELDISDSNSLLATCTTNHTTLTPYTSLSGSSPCDRTIYWQPGLTYYWSVRAVDAPTNVDGVFSSSGDGAFKLVRGVTAPAYLTPADGATVSVPSLAWQPVAGAVRYTVTVLDAAGNQVASQQTYSPDFTVPVTLADGTYSWFVQSTNAEQFTTAVPTSGRPTFTLRATDATAASPDPVSPANNSATLRMPTLSWLPVRNAASYTLHVSANGAELNPVAGLTNPAWTSTDVPLQPNTYSWWVVAKNSSGANLATGATATFVISSIRGTLVSGYATGYQTPGNGSTSNVSCGGTTLCMDTPTMSWKPVPDATSYLVTVASDPDFTTIYRNYSTIYSALTPAESYLDSQAGSAYYWFVTPCITFNYSTTSCGLNAQSSVANGAAPSFKKRSAAVVTCPQDTSTGSSPALCPLSQSVPDPDRQITFSWSDYLASNAPPTSVPAATQEASLYRLQVATSPDFASASVIDDQQVDGTSYAPATTTYPDGPLYWRVAALDDSGNLLTWSAVGTVHKNLAAPVQNLTTDPTGDTSPLPSVVSGVPLLTWQASQFAAYYDIEIYANDPNFSSTNRIISASSKFTAYAPASTLVPGTYTWRVRAEDGANRPGPWYTDGSGIAPRTMTFTIVPAAPVLTPVNQHVLLSGNVVFRWTPVVGAAQYQWQLISSQGYVAGSQNTVMTEWSPTVDFPDGNYHWQVQALDAAGHVLSTSAPSTVSRDATAPSVSSVIQTVSTAALSVTGSVDITFSEPVTGVSSSTVRVQPSGVTALAPGTVRMTSANTARWTPSKPLVTGQTYTLSVTSSVHDLAGNPLTANSWTTRVSTVAESGTPAIDELWQRQISSAASARSYDAAKDAGDSVGYSFTGPSIALVGMRAPTGGNAALYVDGKKVVAALSFYAPRVQNQYRMWSTTHLSAGTHTITLVVLGTRARAAKDSWVYLDGFAVGSMTIDQSNAAVHEWFRRVASTIASAGSYDLTDYASSRHSSTRPSFTLSFRGTSVSVAAIASTSAGKAGVYLDNRYVASVDLRSTSTYVTTCYSIGGLADRVHTIRIDALGTSSGAGSGIGIDSIGVG